MTKFKYKNNKDTHKLSITADNEEKANEILEQFKKDSKFKDVEFTLIK